jgi:hypothetical protein
MNYEQVKALVTWTAIVADGYNGAQAKVGLARVDGVWWEVNKTGCHKCYRFPDYLSIFSDRRYTNLREASGPICFDPDK